jgi:hypothetical protein
MASIFVKTRTYNVASLLYAHRVSTSQLADNLSQPLEIKRGAFGLGAFAVNKIRIDQFLGGTFPLFFLITAIHLRLYFGLQLQSTSVK